jgi:CHAT domain-containing protein
LVADLRQNLLAFDLSAFNKKSARLYTLLLADALEGITEEKLIIIPHGSLHYLPFAALFDGEAYLIDRFTLISDPSASVLRFISDKRKEESDAVLAFGNPVTEHAPLPYTETEVWSISEVMRGVDVYIGKSATETLGKNIFSDYNIIHLACHGKFNEDAPLLSSLYLTGDQKNDGELNVHELFSLDLTGSSLVVLSACETGLSEVMKGDELIGLSRGFLYAGTPSLLVTLWEVADESTARLMVTFYENVRLGMSKPEALAEAQRTLKDKEQYEHPFYWAPFVLIGDWE